MRFGSWLPNDFGTCSIPTTSDSNAPLMVAAGRRLSNRGVRVYAAIDTRIVARDIFLEVNTFIDSHSVDKLYLAGDRAVGVVWQSQGGEVAYSQIVRSRQCQEQSESHCFSSFIVSIEY